MTAADLIIEDVDPTSRKRLAAMHSDDLESERQWIEGELEHLERLALEGEPVGTVVSKYQADMDALLDEITRRKRAGTLPRGGTRPSYDRAFIDRVKAATDLVALIEASGTSLKKAGKTFKALCPFHDEKTPSFVVYPDNGHWHCYGACGAGGDAIAWLMQRDGLTFHQAIDTLAKDAGIALPARTPFVPTAPDNGQPAAIVFEGQSTTDMANEQRFAVLNRDKARYVKGWGWMVYTGHHWERDELAAMVLARDVVIGIYGEARQQAGEVERKALALHAIRTESLKSREAMLRGARSQTEMRATQEDFDTDGWLFNVANGTLSLRAGTLRPHASGDMLTKMAPVSFEDDADLGHWKRHIEYFLPNPDVRRYVQRQLGRSLVGEHQADELPIWWGEGANGRSTIVNALKGVLGDYCQQTAPKLLLASKYERHPTELADLYGSRLVFSIEIEEGARLAESLAKQLSGGDRVKAHYMRRDDFEFDATWTITMVTNHKPVIRTGGGAMWRRIKLVPWTVSIPLEEQRAQADVVAELVEDGPAVLRWLLKGLADWLADIHWCPDEVQAATESYRAEQDPLREWIAECCFLGPDAWASASALRASYKAHGAESGVPERDLVSGAKWGDGLRAIGGTRRRQYVGNVRTRGWRGVGLRYGTEGTDSSISPPGNPLREGNTGDPVPAVPQQGEMGAGEGLVDDDGNPIPF